MADGGFFVSLRFDFLDKVAAGFEHVVKELEFYVGEVLVLPVFELAAQVVLVGAPASQGFEGDGKAVFDEAEVSVVFIE